MTTNFEHTPVAQDPQNDCFRFDIGNVCLLLAFVLALSVGIYGSNASVEIEAIPWAVICTVISLSCLWGVTRTWKALKRVYKWTPGGITLTGILSVVFGFLSLLGIFFLYRAIMIFAKHGFGLFY